MLLIHPNYNGGIIYCRENAAILFLLLTIAAALGLAWRAHKGFSFWILMLLDSLTALYAADNFLIRLPYTSQAYALMFAAVFIVSIMLRTLLRSVFIRVENCLSKAVLRTLLRIISLAVSSCVLFFAFSVLTGLPQRLLLLLVLLLTAGGLIAQLRGAEKNPRSPGYGEIYRRSPVQGPDLKGKLL